MIRVYIVCAQIVSILPHTVTYQLHSSERCLNNHSYGAVLTGVIVDPFESLTRVDVAESTLLDTKVTVTVDEAVSARLLA